MAQQTWTTISIKKNTFNELQAKRHSYKYTETWDDFLKEILEQFDPDDTQGGAK